MDEIEVARKYLELGITPETVAHPEVVEIELERESLSPAEQFWIMEASLSGRRKWTYRSPEDKLPIRNPDWMSMVTSNDDPFWCIFEELDQAHFQYSKLEMVTKRLLSSFVIARWTTL